jgi:glycosyltransferase involved in cell wall biosynthesis
MQSTQHAIGMATIAQEACVEVSVVIPCLNEAVTIGRCIDRATQAFRRLQLPGEVVVADNGSTDGSSEIALEHGARVVSVREKGYGNALQGGINAAHGRYVIMGDADDSYDLGDLEPFVVRLRAGDDVVIGNRFRGESSPGPCPGFTGISVTPSCRACLTSSFTRQSAMRTAAYAPSAKIPTNA